MQNADLVISLGSRLDTHFVGSPAKDFAREAKKIIIDIDQYELKKFLKMEMGDLMLLHMDAADVVNGILKSDFIPNIKSDWAQYIDKTAKALPQITDAYRNETLLNPYVFVEGLSAKTADGTRIVCDTGCGLAWFMQSYPFLNNERFIHAFNNTPMGYAVPAALAAAILDTSLPTYCVVGDGSLMMNIQELATLRHHNVPVIVFVINNGGYSMIRQTQEQWFNNDYFGSSDGKDLFFPDYQKVAASYEMDYVRLEKNADIDDTLDVLLKTTSPIICDVVIAPEHRVLPQVKFGYPIEDMEPLLEENELHKHMIIPPLKRKQ